jgi:hypothetical protein
MSDTAPPALVCTICLSPVESESEAVACPSCSAVYHRECWEENGGCGVYGCSQAPAVEPRGAMEIPAGFWGRQKKNCPVCQAEIAAAAVRCRQCGTTFESAVPVEAQAFQQKAKLDSVLPSARRHVITIFVLCVVTCTAPLGVIYGLVWWSTHRAAVRASPSLYGALCKIGLGVGALQILAIAVFCMIHSATHHS